MKSHGLSILVPSSLLLAFGLAVTGFSAVGRTARHEARLGFTRRLPAVESRTFSGPQASTLAPDILLSEAISPARFRQERPSAAPLANGNLVVAWQDERQGCTKIFLQVIDQSGAAVGANQLIAATPSGGNLVEPLLDVDTLGRVYLFYRDRDHGLVFAQRFNADLSVDLPPFLVNDTSSGAYGGPFGADLYPNGRMVVAWENYALSGQTVQMRIFDNTGASLFGPADVPSSLPGVQRWEPDVAVQPSGDILVVWEDYRNGNADIYARQFAGDGTPVSSDFGMVPAGPNAADQYQPRVEYGAGFGFAIAWVDLRTAQDIYLQRFSPVSGLIGANRLVSVPTPGVETWDVDLAVSRSSELSVTWSSAGSQNAILRQRYSLALVEIGGAATLSLQPLQTRWQPSLTYLGTTRFASAWTDAFDNEPDIAVMLFDTSGTRLLAEELVVNGDQSGAPATSTALVALPGGTAHVAFCDRRSDDGDLFGQYVSLVVGKEGTNTRVNQDVGLTLQSDPAVTRRDDQLAIVWSDSRLGSGLTDHAVYGRFGSIRNGTHSAEFQVSDPTESEIKSGPAAAFCANSELLAAWQDFRTVPPTLIARWMSSSGIPNGSEITVATSGNIRAGTPIHMGTDNSGKTWILWSAPDNGDIVLKGQAYDASHAAAGSFTWSPVLVGVAMVEIAADVAADGSITVLWVGQSAGSTRVYLTVLNSGGIETAVSRAVSDLPSLSPEAPRISSDELGYRVAGWLDYRTGLPRPYFQVLSPALAPVGGNQPVSATSSECAFGFQLDSYRGKVWFSWIDSRAGGNQPYATVYVYEPTDVDDAGSRLPSSYALHQNYPNPFNPSTTIAFDLPRQSSVRLEVFDLLGRRVAVLADQEFAAGSHRVDWNGRAADGRAVASGVYLYRLSTDHVVESRKMILLK